MVAAAGPDLAFRRRMLIFSVQRHRIFFSVFCLVGAPLLATVGGHGFLEWVISRGRWAPSCFLLGAFRLEETLTKT